MVSFSTSPFVLIPPISSTFRRPLSNSMYFSSGYPLIVRRGFQVTGATVAVNLTQGFSGSSSLERVCGDSHKNHDEVLDNLFSCPICYEPLIRKGPAGLNLPAVYRSGFKCKKCDRSFTSKDGYLDLTITSNATVYNEIKPVRTELFRSPVVSFLYERGWRQNFGRSGFPGLDEEFKMAQEYFKPVAGGVLVDVSCGSGLFSRKFGASRTYSAVIALDFSESMLRQCIEFIKQETSPLTMNIAVLRADVSRLPFSSGSIDAVHAGAAIHCWPSPSNAVAEISRVLKSGGIFVATTFLATALNSPFSYEQLRPLRPLFGLVANTYNYFTEKEIEDLCKSCGLINYSAKVQRAFIMFSAQKP